MSVDALPSPLNLYVNQSTLLDYNALALNSLIFHLIRRLMPLLLNPLNLYLPINPHRWSEIL